MPVDSSARIHPTAIVEDGATIGARSAIWHHSHVRSGARIGADCVVGKNVYVDSAAVIGDRCKIQNNVSVYSGVQLGDEVFVGPSVVFTNDLYPRAASPNWQIIDTVVHAGASIGANATLVCGITIGSWATVAAGSVVVHDVRRHELVAGNPARRLGWVCRCGHTVELTSHDYSGGACGHCGLTLEAAGTFQQ